uniref:Uncharacterized protein n=1 Tax=Rhipicephalus zambeziensis TaxID=60191 RepID=A0A224Y8U5_9ACAR
MIRASVLLLLVLGRVAQTYRFRFTRPPGHPPPTFPQLPLMPPPTDPDQEPRFLITPPTEPDKEPRFGGGFFPSPIPISALVPRPDGPLTTGPVPLALADPPTVIGSTTDIQTLPGGDLPPRADVRPLPITTYWPDTYPLFPEALDPLLPPPPPYPNGGVVATSTRRPTPRFLSGLPPPPPIPNYI